MQSALSARPVWLTHLLLMLGALALPAFCHAAPAALPPALHRADSPGPCAAPQPAAVPAAQSPPATPVEPIIDVYTMGPGGYFFSLFGHAAICVTDAQSPAGRCYNWGTADFSNPLRLAWQVMRGRAQFWVGTVALPRMVVNYMAEDRSLYRQRLRLSAAATQRIVDRLHRVDDRVQSQYTYHNLRDNCTTRVRDLINDAANDLLSADPRLHHRDQPSFRSYSYEGFAGRPHLLAGALLLFGRATDHPTSRYEGLFLPRILREEVATRLQILPDPVYQRSGPSPHGSRHAGVLFLLGTGLLAGLTCLLLGLRGAFAAALRVATLPLGLVGCLLGLLLVVSPLPELRYNEVLLLCWPSDLFVPELSAPRRRAYLNLRLAGCAVAPLGVWLGLLKQPLWGPLLWVVPALLAAWVTARRCDRERLER